VRPPDAAPLIHVEWVDTDTGLAAFVGRSCVATGDYDSAADAVSGYLRRLALTTPTGRVRAEFAHHGATLGTVLVDASGVVHPSPESPADAPDPPADAPEPPADAPDPPADAPASTADAPEPSADAPASAAAAHDVPADPADALMAALRSSAASPTAIPGSPAPAGPTRRGSVPEHPPYRPASTSAADLRRAPRTPRGEVTQPRRRPTLVRRGAGRPERAAPTKPDTAPARAPATHDTRERSGRKLFVIGAVAVVALVAIVAVSALLMRGRPTVTIVRDEAIGVTAPAEWDTKARWRTPPLLTDSGRVLMVDGTAMAFVTSDRVVALVDVAGGEARWTARYPDGTPGTDLAVSTVDGRRVIAAAVGDRLAWWDLESGEAHDIALPPGATVRLHGTAPLVVTDQGRTASMVVGGKLAGCPVPDGATPLAARSDGVVTATGPAGWWHLRPGQVTPNPVAWESPGPPGAPTIVAYLGESIVTVLSSPTKGSAYLAVYSDRARDVRFAWGGPAWFDGDAADWYPSPSRRWGILGRTMVDLTSGRSADLGSWRTELVSADRALGRIGTQRVLVGPQIPAGALPDDEAFPEDLATTAAAVRATVGAEELVYLLPPKGAP